MKCLDIFKAEISEIHELVQLQDLARHIFTRYTHILIKSEDSKYWAGEVSLKKFTEQMKSGPTIINRALYVLAWGSFEEFFRRLVSESAIIINKKKKLVVKDGTLWNQHAIVCSDVLKKNIEGTKFHKLDVQSLARDLSSGVAAEGVWNLNAEALSAFGGKMDDDQLEKYGKRVGVNLSWLKVADAQIVKDFKSKDPLSSGTTEKWARAKFCEIRDRRNIFAHEGIGDGECEVHDVNEALDFLLLLAERIVERALEDIPECFDLKDN